LTTTSQFVPGLQPNATYYVRLVTSTGTTSTSSDTSFTTGRAIAHLISPAAGATNVDPFAAFQWSSVASAQVYTLKIGTTQGIIDVYNSGEIAAGITSWLVPGMLGGQSYYFEMWTKENNSWYKTTGTFTTAVQPLPSSATTFRQTVQNLTGQVRLMTNGTTNTPIPGTPLAQVVAQDGRTTAFCTEYARTLAQLLIAQRTSVRVRSINFDGNSFESHVTTEYWDPFLSKWIVADPTFGVVYWNTATLSGMAVSDVSTAVASQAWSSIPILYATTKLGVYSTNYYMDPILLYLNPLGPGVTVAAPPPLPHDPSPFLTTQSSSVIGTKGFYLFSFVNQTDTVTLSDPSQGVVTLGPLSGEIYSKVITLAKGWTITAQPAGLKLLTINRYLF
jgi:hypothetical protein